MHGSSSANGWIPRAADGVDALDEIHLLLGRREIKGVPAELVRVRLSVSPVGNKVTGIDLHKWRVADRGTNAVEPTTE